MWKCAEAAAGYISAANCVELIFIQIFPVDSEIGLCMFCAVECIIAVQGQPRSLISVQIESA